MKENKIREVLEFKISNGKSVEEVNRGKTNRLGWGNYTDVLFSILSILTLGIRAYYPNLFEIKNTTIRLKGSEQRLYSRNYMKNSLHEYPELLNLKELEEFVGLYFSLGNVIPMFPGGNVNRGVSGIYDSFDIYYKKYTNTYDAYISKDLNLKLSSVYIDDFFNTEYTSVETLLNFDKELYLKYLRRNIQIIKERNIKLSELL